MFRIEDNNKINTIIQEKWFEDIKCIPMILMHGKPLEGVFI